MKPLLILIFSLAASAPSVAAGPDVLLSPTSRTTEAAEIEKEITAIFACGALYGQADTAKILGKIFSIPKDCLGYVSIAKKNGFPE